MQFGSFQFNTGLWNGNPGIVTSNLDLSGTDVVVQTLSGEDELLGSYTGVTKNTPVRTGRTSISSPFGGISSRIGTN
jgi:hypothetical protein